MSFPRPGTSPRSARDPRILAWWRAFAGLILAQLLAVQVLPAVHHVLVQHVLCSTHGELTHAHEAAPAKAASPGAEEGFEEGASCEDAHQHCGLPTGARERAAAPRAAGELPAPAPGEPAARASSAAEAVRSIELLSLAPKLSPPLA